MFRRKKKTIHFIRHSQSTFSIPPHDTQQLDPNLTPLGKQQAENLGKSFRNINSVDLIVSSPLKRALYTALYAFKEHLTATGKQIIALPELQELSQHRCDTGVSLPELLTAFREEPVDFSLVPFNWDNKDGDWAASGRRCIQRAKRVRQWLRDRPEKEIVVVGHGHCMQLIVEEGSFLEIRSGICFPEWQNTECRSYRFDSDSDDNPKLRETKDSVEARAKRRQTSPMSKEARNRTNGLGNISNGSCESTPSQAGKGD